MIYRSGSGFHWGLFVGITAGILVILFTALYFWRRHLKRNM
ncbi:MAG: hypothetical protein ACK52J_00945 [bacterium]|jgi:hypothetical protein